MNPEPSKHIVGVKVKNREQGYSFADVLVFMIPFSRFIRVKMVGVLSGSDLLFILAFIFLAIGRKLKIGLPGERRLLFLGVLWLASQCATDIVRHSAFADYARGWSNIGFTLVNFVVLITLLYGNRRRLFLFGWGLAFGTLLTVTFNPDEYMKIDPWKFGFSNSFSWAVLLIASSKRCKSGWAVVLTSLAGLVNFAMGARSIGGVCLAAAVYLIIRYILRRRGLGQARLTIGTASLLAGLIVVGAVGIFMTYKYAASTGKLGEEAKEKYEEQSSGRFGLLLGGRTEVLGYGPAIFDSPLLGHGSWARDPKYLIMERQAQAILGYTNAEDMSLEEMQEGLIPTHSYIFGAWVDAGILGAIFWIWILILTLKALARLHATGAMLVPMSAFAAVFMIWNLLFAPYGSEMRIIAPFYVVLLMSGLAPSPKRAVVIPVRSVKRRVRRIIPASPKPAAS